MIFIYMKVKTKYTGKCHYKYIKMLGWSMIHFNIYVLGNLSAMKSLSSVSGFLF
jgi:hypothetical protein